MSSVQNDLEYNYKEALEFLKVKQSDIDKIRSKLPENVPCSVTDKKLLLFYNACNFDLDSTLQVIESYYSAKKSTAEHFQKLDPLDESIQQCLENQAYFVIPPVEKYGYIIIYHKLMNATASNYLFDNAVKTYIMSFEIALSKYGPTKGIIFLHDMEFVRFSHIFRARIKTIRSFLNFIQYSMPAKVKSIHVFNVNSMFNKILALIRPFLKKELLDIIYTHPPNMNLDEFYKTVIPKSHLPEDYGGDLATVQELHAKFVSEYKRYREYFLTDEKICWG